VKVAILGAGVAGVSCAIALQRIGYDVAVYERHAELSSLGAGIVCWPNGAFVLDKLGLLSDIAKVSGRLVSMNRWSDEGEDLGGINVLALNKAMGYPSYAMLRRDLMMVLMSHLNQLGIQVEFNHEVVKLEAGSDGVTTVCFEHGGSIEADMVIGAEGRMNSASRAFVTGDNSAMYQGFVNWVGVFESDKVVFKDVAVNDYWGVGERFGIVPVSPNKAYWAGAIAAEIGDAEKSTYKLELLSVFNDWPGLIAKMITSTPLSNMNKIYVHDHDPIDVWHKGNVLLIGDAAHASLPTSGQGVCQALEDVWHLMKLLTLDAPNLDKVFADFTALRQAKTKGITLGARQFADSLFNTSRPLSLRRNESSKATDFSAVVEGMARGWSSGLPMGGG